MDLRESEGIHERGLKEERGYGVIIISKNYLKKKSPGMVAHT